MSIAAELFNMNPRTVKNAKELADKLEKALLASGGRATAEDERLLGMFWRLLNLYRAKRLTDAKFWQLTRRLFHALR